MEELGTLSSRCGQKPVLMRLTYAGPASSPSELVAFADAGFRGEMVFEAEARHIRARQLS